MLIICLFAIFLTIQDASKTGVAQETLQNLGAKSSKVMTEHEARMILGINENTSVEEMLQVIRCNNKFGYFNGRNVTGIRF